MYTPAALADQHERTHQNFSGLIDHCRSLQPEAFNRAIEGFGFPSVREQIHHAIGAEIYWVGVIQGRILTDEDESLRTAESLQNLRATVFRTTRDYLSNADEAELNTPRPMTTYGGSRRILMPARVILRITTHLHHHIGQIAAMSRILEHPIPGYDFPIE